MSIQLNGTTGVTFPDGVTQTSGLATPISVANGGSGRTTNTAFAVVCGGTTTGGAEQSIASVGTTGQVLTSNGAGALPTFQAASAGGLGGMQVYTTAQTNTAFTIPAGITKLKVTVQAGGGGGAASGAGDFGIVSFGGSAGGGGTAIQFLSGLTPGNTILVTVGAGGTGGTAPSSNGGPGGVSSITSGSQTISTISATGGAGGLVSQQNANGGSASGGSLNILGGGASSTLSPGSIPATGIPGNSFLGMGGQNRATVVAGPLPGFAGQLGGGGSGGIVDGPGSAAGGAGGAGAVIIEW